MSTVLVALVLSSGLMLPGATTAAPLDASRVQFAAQRSDGVTAFERSGGATKGLWHPLVVVPAARAGADSRPDVHPKRFVALTLDKAGMASTLASAPLEFTRAAVNSPLVLALPTPDGGFARFAVQESPVVAPELAARYPQIKTYDGQGIDDPWATIRFDLGLTGFHAQVLSPHGAWYIDPYYHLDDSVYASYFGRDLQARAGRFHDLQARPVGRSQKPASDLAVPVTSVESRTAGTQLRTYRLALAADGEYSTFQGGTVPLVHNAMVTAVNRVTGIYQTELAIRLQLVATNDSLIYLNAATDPYDENGDLLAENQTNIDSVIGTTHYDIGHVFTTTWGGVAGLGAVGLDGYKAWGETGLPNEVGGPTGDMFYVDFVAHEMGHQFGAEHTFNGCQGDTGGAGTAMEPGSGSTIMGYAGTCGADDLQLHSDPYFHAVSFDQIQAFVTTPGSPGNLGAHATTNNFPTVAITGGPFTIPKRTPFALSATGSDANGDALTFAWEEYDDGASRSLTDPPGTTGPLFRSYLATTSSVRTFPNMASILSNETDANSGSCPALPDGLDCLSEMLPTAARSMAFRVTARDNRVDGGGVNSANTTVTVAAAGPFLVTSPNTAVTLAGGSAQVITWNVAGTSAAPINTANVTILLSIDGGNSFSTVLAASTPNDGTQSVTIPNTPSGQARVKIAAVGNIYFDISDVDFTISAGSALPPNDNFASATALSGSSPTRDGDWNVNGTLETGEPVILATAGGASVWYAWTAPATGPVTIDTYTSSFNTMLGVYTGTSVDALTLVASNDDAAAGLQSQVGFAGQSGTAYKIKVDGFHGLSGAVTLHIAQALPVPGAPTIGTATAGNGQATITFSAPASDGGSAITGYTATSSPAGGTDSNAGTTGLSHVVTGLTNGVAYTFTVTASNASGTGPPSSPSNSVTPTGGAAGRKADGLIRKGTGAFIGNNIYNLTGASQTKIGAKAVGSTVKFGISIQNDATTGADTFKLSVAGTASAFYTVTYWHGTTNITAAVVAGTFTTPALLPGKTYLVIAKVKVNSGATAGSNTSRLVTITSVGDNTKQDAVMFTGKRL